MPTDNWWDCSTAPIGFIPNLIVGVEYILKIKDRKTKSIKFVTLECVDMGYKNWFEIDENKYKSLGVYHNADL